MAVSLSAQSGDTPFKKGKVYVNAGFSGLDLNYNGSQKWSLTLFGKGGYMIQDNVMIMADAMWGMYKGSNNEFRLGAGARYYIAQNGIYLGAGARYKHRGNYDDFMPNVNIGYTHFLSRTVTIEPELYYDFSTKSFSDHSGFGLRIGLGIYL